MVVGKEELLRLAAGVGVLLVTEHIGGICYLSEVQSWVSVLKPLSRSLGRDGVQYRESSDRCRGAETFAEVRQKPKTLREP